MFNKKRKTYKIIRGTFLNCTRNNPTYRMFTIRTREGKTLTIGVKHEVTFKNDPKKRVKFFGVRTFGHRWPWTWDLSWVLTFFEFRTNDEIFFKCLNVPDFEETKNTWCIRIPNFDAETITKVKRRRERK